MRSGGPDDTDDTQNQDDDGPSPVFGGGMFGGGSRRSPGGGFGGFGGSDIPEIHIGRGWKILGAIALILFLLMSAFSLSVGMATDAIWFQSVGFASVFWTRVGSEILFFGVGAGIALAVLWINLWLAGRAIPKGQLRQFSLDDLMERFNIERYIGGDFVEKRPVVVSRPRGPKGPQVDVPDISRPVFWVLLAAAIILALGLGGLAVSGWDTIQLYLHRVPFGQTDLTFGKDIGFFLFELPFYRLVQSYANTLLLMTLVGVGIRYIIAVASGASMPTSARIHLGALAALYLWSAAIGYQLDRYELVNSNTSGIFQGASFTDVNARMLAMNVMTALTAFVGCFVLAFTVTRWKAPVVLTLLFWAASFLILEVGYPQVVQRISVEPNQQAQESPYIDANIKMTRLAFNLTNWSATTKDTPQATVTPANVAAEPATIQNVRLWDYRPLKDTISGVQQIRQYYTFPDVDTDRYYFTDAASCSPSPAPCVRQVMLTGRELDEGQLAQLNKGDQSWVNQHITYTHGYGLVMVPVNEVQSGSGQPTLFVKDFPPVSVKGVPTVTRPQIYFGTKSTGYVIVDASSPEFDYPPSSCKGCPDQYVSWSGTSGIKLDTLLSKLLFATKFGDLNMLISSQITGSSQLLYNRSIRDRVSEVAPFLRLDKDPYMVLRSDGTLAYVQDAFTTSASFPDANSYNPGTDPNSNGLAGDSFNYIRNSVKVVMDAYSGDLTFYVTDQSDPIIKAWEGVFPGLFKQFSDMPVDLKGDAATGNPGHLRYPEDLLNAQTAQFTKYHVTDPGVFYQGNDIWDLPPSADSGGNGTPTQLGLEAYYVQMRIPGEANPEFVLLQPMVPQGRQNMIAWVAAHNDPGSYGQVSVFDYPSSSNVFGPQQMESLIAQNGDISRQVTLWNNNGSKVIMGNLLVIPLQDSILYIEPVYLQASSNPLPILQKVIVGTPSQVVWGDTLQDALDQIYAGKGSTGTGGSASPGPSASGSPGITASPGTSGTSPPSATPTASGAPSALPSVSLSGSAQQLVVQANEHFVAAQTAARNGDWATYGKEMEIVQQILAQLEKVVGTPAPSGQ